MLDAASRGETISITKRGRPVARLVPPEAPDWSRAVAAAKKPSGIARRDRLGDAGADIGDARRESALIGPVIDCSITVAWIIEDEISAGTNAVLDRVIDVGACAPDLWWTELRNVLVASEPRGRIVKFVPCEES